jgi:hypothetical protein
MQLMGNGIKDPLQARAVPDRANNAERIITWITSGTTFTVRVSGWNIPLSPQNYSLVITVPPGTIALPRNQCPECSAGQSLSCSVPHGVGLKKCSRSTGRYGLECIVSTCAKGYTISSWSNSMYINYIMVRDLVEKRFS